MERPRTLGNPFIKPKNQNWVVEPPSSLLKPVSPPPTLTSTKRKKEQDSSPNIPSKFLQSTPESLLPPSAAIDAGKLTNDDHLAYFTTKLSSKTKSPAAQSNLPIEEYVDLYKRNQRPGGHHFVIHQHDHPIAGVHYDLRLQISETSSISFAIMYGLPGNPNSKRINRNATETRVHNLWNHLIETASNQTGSLLIWDTGEYEILSRNINHNIDTDSDNDILTSNPLSSSSPTTITLAESEKLHTAFQARKIKLRLHGTKLPPNYTLSLRLTSSENRTEQPKKPSRKRRRMAPGKKDPVETPPGSYVEAEVSDDEIVPSQPQNGETEKSQATSLMEAEIREQEDEAVRLTNAYPGTTNSIGSIHQRKWYLSIDRVASGFYKARNAPAVWKRREEEGFEAFFVRGRDVERSVVTGRNADEIMRDEGVEGFVGRRGWRGVLD